MQTHLMGRIAPELTTEHYQGGSHNMATKAKKSDERELEDDELTDKADEDTEETDEDEDETEDDEDEGGEEGDGGKGSKGGTKKKETEQERLARENEMLRKQLRAANRKAREVEGKLTKAGITDKDDPEDIKAQLAQARAEAQRRAEKLRLSQENDAIREVLSDDDAYTPYLKSVKYIRVELDLSDDDLDENGEYDPDTLKEAAERAVRAYVRNQPKPEKKMGSGGGAGGAGGSGGKGGAGGDPSRGGPNKAETQAEKLQKLDKTFGGVLSGIGAIPRTR